jgi:8-oxo-dGTP pyrophosphatase MutT (NUDIX family)
LIEPGDLDAQRAALREAEEEIGLRPQDVRVLGTLDPLYTVTQFHVTPVVAAFPWPYRLRQNPREVASVFGVPLTWLRQPGNLDVRPRQLPPPGKTVSVFYFRPYEGHVIWGATARIVVQLLQELAALPGGGKDERGG